MAKASKKAASKKGSSKQASGKRETISPKGDKRYIRRDSKGRIKESDDVGKSLSRDVKQTSRTKVKPGYGDKGDQPVKAVAKKTASKKSSKKK